MGKSSSRGAAKGYFPSSASLDIFDFKVNQIIF